jgi:glycerol-3-phosphate dehydrogenase
VNAAGPWVDQALRQSAGENERRNVRLVQGSHIVVRKLFGHDKCYIFQNKDNRIIFAIPYEGDFTLIGTTDEDHKGDPGAPRITDAETDYLLKAVSEYFRKPVTRKDVRWAYSGIRPLYDDGASKAQEATRDYVLKLDHPEGGAPLLSIFGGKITTARKLAEAAMEKIAPFLPQMGKPWTAAAPLPGGDFPFAEVGSRIAALAQAYPFLPQAMIRRMFRAYGTDTANILDGARSLADMGQGFGPITAREVEWLKREEWARSADDVMWRRSKLGLHMSEQEQEALRRYFTPVS